MRDNVWKYISMILIMLLILSAVSTTVLYFQTSNLKAEPYNTTTVTRVESNCTYDEYELKIAELENQIRFLKSRISRPSPGNATVVVLPIFGLIDNYAALNIIPTLRTLAENSSVSGVVLWIESPGGEVGPVIEIYNEVKKLSLLKPVVAYTGGLAASGGYYIALGADKIIAAPLAEVGSIGVLYVHYNLEENYEMNGIKVEVFKTGPHKDMGAEWRALREDEKKQIIKTVDTYFDAFLSAFTEGRGMDREHAKEYTTGEVWFAKEVNGTLVDDIGDVDKAISVISEMLNVTNPRVLILSSGGAREFSVYGSTALFMDPRYLSPYLRG
ncbi:MAG: protease [Thermococcaceae archaeon]|nr:protease [Thermococcaceae archaeon]